MAHELSITVERDGQHFVESSVERGKVLEGPFATAEEALRRSKERSNGTAPSLTLGSTSAFIPELQVRPKSPAPQFDEDPLAAIGFVLSSVSAGIQGRELPIVGLKREQAASEAQELRKFTVGINALSAIGAQAERLPFDQRNAFIEQASQKFNETLGPGFGEILKRMIAQPNSSRVFAIAGDLAPELHRMFGEDIKGAEDFLLDPQNRAFLEESVRRRHIGSAMAKIQNLISKISGPLRQMLVDSGKVDDEGNPAITSSELRTLNAQVPKDDPNKLTPQELLAFELEQERNPDVAREIGLRIVPEVSSEEAAKRAAEKTTAVERAKVAVKGRELETARTVELTEDFRLPGGGSVPRGTPITVRPVKGESFSVTSVFQDGKMVEVEIPDSIIPSVQRERTSEIPTAAQKGRVALRIAFLDDAANNVQKLLEITKTTPTGAALQIVSALQGTFDSLVTLAETIPGVDGLVEFVGSGVDVLNDRLGDDEESVLFREEYQGRLINPDIPAIDILEEAIAIALAASSFPATQRVPVEAIKEARKNVDIGGLLTGTETAQRKLLAVLDRIQSNRDALAGSAALQAEPEITTKKKEETPAQRIKRLKEKFGLE